MKFMTLITSLVIISTTALPAMAGSFSFNKASAEEMVNACKEEGIELPKEIADAIVETRKSTTFAYEQDLMIYRYWGDLSIREVADILEKPKSTVESQLKNLEEKIRKF